MRSIARKIIVIIIWIVIWQGVYWLVDEQVLFASPLQTLAALKALVLRAVLWQSVLSSVLRVMAGFLLGTVLGCIFAAVTYMSDFLRDLFRPLMTVIKATPVASFIILAFVWIPVKYVPIFTALLIVTPIFWTNIYAAVGQTDKGLLEMAYVYEMKPIAKFTKIYVPSVMPSFVGSVNAAIGMAWKASIAAEVICRCKSSIGGGLYAAKIAIDTDKVFAWTAVVIILSLIFEKLAVTVVERIFRRWNHA